MYDGSVEPDLSGEDDESESRISEIARKQVIVAYAGAESQRMLHPEQRESEIAASAEDDYSKITNIAEECKLSCADLERAKQEAALLVQQLRGVIQAFILSLPHVILAVRYIEAVSPTNITKGSDLASVEIDQKLHWKPVCVRTALAHKSVALIWSERRH
jgi:hypothetical protein